MDRSDISLVSCECQHSPPPIHQELFIEPECANGRKSQKWSCNVPLTLGRGRWRSKDWLTLSREAGHSALVIPNVPLWGRGNADEGEVKLPGESVRGFYFSASLFFYPCYFSQSPGNRKHIPSFHLHMSSIPTGEREALFPTHMGPHLPRRLCYLSCKGEGTSNNNNIPTHKICLRRNFSINIISSVVLHYSKKQHQLPSVVILLDHLLCVYGLGSNNSTHIC